MNFMSNNEQIASSASESRLRAKPTARETGDACDACDACGLGGLRCVRAL